MKPSLPVDIKCGSRLTPAEAQKLLSSKGYLKKPMPVNKFRNVFTEVDGIRFHSKAEATHYERLWILRRTGHIKMFMRQVPFDLPAGLKYVADFVVLGKDGTLAIHEVKGKRTPEYIMKRKLVEDSYCKPFGVIFQEYGVDYKERP